MTKTYDHAQLVMAAEALAVFAADCSTTVGDSLDDKVVQEIQNRAALAGRDWRGGVTTKNDMRRCLSELCLYLYQTLDRFGRDELTQAGPLRVSWSWIETALRKPECAYVRIPVLYKGGPMQNGLFILQSVERESGSGKSFNLVCMEPTTRAVYTFHAVTD